MSLSEVDQSIPIEASVIVYKMASALEQRLSQMLEAFGEVKNPNIESVEVQRGFTPEGNRFVRWNPSNERVGADGHPSGRRRSDFHFQHLAVVDLYSKSYLSCSSPKACARKLLRGRCSGLGDQAPQRLKPCLSRAVVARLKSCPSRLRSGGTLELHSGQAPEAVPFPFRKNPPKRSLDGAPPGSRGAKSAGGAPTCLAPVRLSIGHRTVRSPGNSTSMTCFFRLTWIE